MKPGDILLFKAEKDLASKLIAWGTNSLYSHVAICVSEEMNLAIESIPGGGVRGRDIRKIQETYDVYSIKDGYSFDLHSTISYLVDKLNAKYDTWGITFLGILKFFIRIGCPLRPIANKWQKDRDYFCSELCYEAFYRGGGLDIVPAVSEADVTSPGDIAKSQIVELIESKKGKEPAMGWYMKMVERVKALDTPMFMLFVSVKALGGLAIGIIIAPYVGRIGWWVLLAAIIISIPLMLKIFKKT
ncbi:MAG: hypothetical protein WC522_03715 [Candidatus Omnitrophota bacterium]